MKGGEVMEGEGEEEREMEKKDKGYEETSLWDGCASGGDVRRL